MPDAGSASVGRLDAELVRRGLARSRAVAVEAIAQGLVTVDGAPASKPALKVAPDAVLEIADADHYVSRGAHKLIAALDHFDVDPAGRVALDAGASTGGFTQVLVERGAARVFAVDVGHGQLAGEMQENPRVANLEGLNLRHLTRESPAFSTYEAELAASGWPSLVVGDVSFISLTQLLAPLAALSEPDADWLLLVKPQFEVGRGGVREGIVRDRALRHDAATAVLWAAWDLGLGALGIIDSPIAGGSGNREYLIHLRRGAPDPSALRDAVEALA
ncbi:MAG: TlyA family RNA methyltransferase [Protaetiibacter sp.]